MNKLIITRTAIHRCCRVSSSKVCPNSIKQQQQHYRRHHTLSRRIPTITTRTTTRRRPAAAAVAAKADRLLLSSQNTSRNYIITSTSTANATRNFYPNTNANTKEQIQTRRQYNSQTQTEALSSKSNTSTNTSTNINTSTSTNTKQIKLIRLSKRMSELDLCSRREADKLIAKSRVLVNGKIVDTLGSKVSQFETDIRIIHEHGHGHDNSSSRNLDWDTIRGDTVVLHKPKAYISGQPDPNHGHVPAVQLLTRQNIFFPDPSPIGIGALDVNELKYTLSSGKYLHFARRKKMRRWRKGGGGGGDDKFYHGASTSNDCTGGNTNSNNSNKNKKNKNDRGNLNQNGMIHNGDNNDSNCDIDNDSDINNNLGPSTLTNYAPAGRLDLDSTGVLIFTKNGTIAKHILSTKTEKEYIAVVEPVYNITREEKQKGIRYLPYPPIWDLSTLKKGGKRLWNDTKSMRPLVGATWIEEGRGKNGKWDGTGMIKFVLREGKKRQIRRMCREVLGLNVKELVRTRVGSVRLDNLPEGRWRTLTEREVRALLE